MDVSKQQANPQQPDLTSHEESTVQAIAELHASHYGRASASERLVGRLVGWVARSRFLIVFFGFSLAWSVLNLALPRVGAHAFDPPPFIALQGLIGFGSFVIAILILMAQRREDALAEIRDKLTLELAMLGDQKAAKIIRLLEESRRDSPHLMDRPDPEAEALAKPADPHAVIEAIRRQESAKLGGETHPLQE